MSDQSMDALAEANRIRTARANLKHDIFDGTVTVAEILDRCPWEAKKMTIAELLRAQRHWGAYRTRRLLAELWISEHRPVGQLTERECKLISFHLVPWRAAA